MIIRSEDVRIQTMSLSIGIVGLPNVGKSTLFNALLKQQVALAANYPFATIEPNVGVAQVPDERLAILAKIVNTQTLKPAIVEFYDIAGLVKGASKGEGLGNTFLSHIRETAAICHVLRAFTDEDVIREGAVGPKADLETIRTELQLADLTTLEKQDEPKGASKPEEKARWHVIQIFKQKTASGQMLQNLNESEFLVARELGLLTAKSEIFVINVDENELAQTQQLAATYATELGVAAHQIVIVSAKIESELSSLSEADQQAYLQDLGLSKSGLQRLAEVAYKTLKLQSFLTAGELEVRAWTIPQGTTAPNAAGVIHTDFTKHFIKAHVATFEDFVACGGWKAVREQGKLRMEGKEYVMQEGDVVEFMIGK